MKTNESAILATILKALNLPTIKSEWENTCHQADTEGWGSVKCLTVLFEQEYNARENKKLTRHIKESRLPKGKTLGSFDFTVYPQLNKTRINTLGTGEGWIKQGTNILIFGNSGVGKSHLAAGIGLRLIESGMRVLFTRTTELVQSLQQAKQSLTLASALDKLDKFDCLCLDDFGYVKRDQFETSVLFELISERYERKSIILTCNQPFGEWDTIFQDKTMAVAAIDRLVHNATILQLNGPSFRPRGVVIDSNCAITAHTQNN
jgi:DNA replication protein DnaC